MENEADLKKNTWNIVRNYKNLFSCEEAVEKLIKAHLETEEEKDAAKKHAF